jgi:hsp70-interacting protein
MNDPNLQKALKWGIENSTASTTADSPRTGLDQEALMALFGGKQKSDADYMIENMHVILNKEHTIENRLQAVDNFEQLVENLDNANNLQSLGLWTPLVETLEDEDSRIRVFAAWCCGTAVQNNIRTQERVSDWTCCNAHERG